MAPLPSHWGAAIYRLLEPETLLRKEPGSAEVQAANACAKELDYVTGVRNQSDPLLLVHLTDSARSLLPN